MRKTNTQKRKAMNIWQILAGMALASAVGFTVGPRIGQASIPAEASNIKDTIKNQILPIYMDYRDNDGLASDFNMGHIYDSMADQERKRLYNDPAATSAISSKTDLDLDNEDTYILKGVKYRVGGIGTDYLNIYVDCSASEAKETLDDKIDEGSDFVTDDVPFSSVIEFANGFINTTSGSISTQTGTGVDKDCKIGYTYRY